MKKKLNLVKRLFIFGLMGMGCSHLHSQTDTLHIYYVGTQTIISDSNEVKIGNWAKKLKGKRWDVEIYTYYDNSDFKKYMVERAENLNLMVIRKARDMITINSMGPIKGKKWQRYMADIVYRPAGASDAPAVATPVPAASPAQAQKNNGAISPPSATVSPAGSSNAPAVQETPAPARNIVAPQNGDVVYDSVYVNGKLKVVKRKVKK